MTPFDDLLRISKIKSMKTLMFATVACLLVTYVCLTLTLRPHLKTPIADHIDTEMGSKNVKTLNNSGDYYNSKSAEFLSGLKKMGIEPSDLHAFKSPLIFTPHVYQDYNNTVLKPPGVRTTKVISIYEGTNDGIEWFIRQRDYNRDFDQCPYSECRVDAEGHEADTADLVLFICRGGLKSPPKHRPTGQLWALGCWESDANWKFREEDYTRVWQHAFNVTFSYRMDSDVFSVYRKLAWRHASRVMEEKDYLTMAKRKTKTATWWAGNCRADRLNFVKEMQKYIDIDIYGDCGLLKCPRKQEKMCLERLNTTYKFYLSFENSFCKSYVTEKVIKLFHIEAYSHVIPVVKGGLDYDEHFPPFTIVNGNEFNSAKDLALHLKDLGSDVYRYARMLQEKDRLVSPVQMMPDWCDVCQMLHTKKFGVYRDIRKSWSHNTCNKSGYRNNDEK